MRVVERIDRATFGIRVDQVLSDRRVIVGGQRPVTRDLVGDLPDRVIAFTLRPQPLSECRHSKSSASMGVLAILPQMTAADRSAEYKRILAENRRYTDAFDRSALTARPLSRLAVVACMDARLDVEETLGLRTGDAHIIRNAGGLVTDDVIRSLIVSVEMLGTHEIVLIEHTRCGLQDLDEDALRARVLEDSGGRDESAGVVYGAFTDLEENLTRQIAILREHPLLGRLATHGLIFDVSNGRLIELA